MLYVNYISRKLGKKREKRAEYTSFFNLGSGYRFEKITSAHGQQNVRERELKVYIDETVLDFSLLCFPNCVNLHSVNLHFFISFDIMFEIPFGKL